MSTPLMPKATAVWLVENTALSFDQIAEFCSLHPLEVKGIADGDVATGIRGEDPTKNGQLTMQEIERCQDDPERRLRLAKDAVLRVAKQKGPRYTPVAKRQDKPDAIAWLVRNFPTMKDAAIIKLIGTTKNTIAAVRNRTHWNSANLNPRDPVLLGLCSQIELNAAIEKVNADRPHTPEAAALQGGYEPSQDEPSQEQPRDTDYSNVMIPEDLFK